MLLNAGLMQTMLSRPPSLQAYSLMDEVARLVLASLNRSCHVRLRSDLWLPLLDDMPLTRVSLASCVHVWWAACHRQLPQLRLWCDLLPAPLHRYATAAGELGQPAGDLAGSLHVCRGHWQRQLPGMCLQSDLWSHLLGDMTLVSPCPGRAPA